MEIISIGIPSSSHGRRVPQLWWMSQRGLASYGLGEVRRSLPDARGQRPLQGRVPAAREEKKADIGGLLVDDPRGCGSSTASRRMPRTPTSSWRRHAHLDSMRSDIFSARATTAWSVPTTRRSPTDTARRWQKVARHHELRGKLRWMRAHSLLVEPAHSLQGRGDRHADRRQRPRHSGMAARISHFR